MKKILMLILLLACANSSDAQKVYAWWDAGVKASYGLTGLLNSKLTKDKNYSYHINTGGGIGAKFGMYIGLNNGFTFDFMYNKLSQGFDYDIGTLTNDQKITWKNYDISLLYRHQSNGAYIEVGPQYSIVNSVTNEDSNDPTHTDVANFYNKNYFSAVFGTGGYIFGVDNFTLMLGIKIGYALTDFVNEQGKLLNFPTPKQAEFTARDSKTNPAFVQLVLEGNLALGSYAKTACSKRAHLFSSF
ncbi:MAG: hypothetical protein ABIO44_14460 [Saprospiraceae bacterium]